jgi:hypothetical protein
MTRLLFDAPTSAGLRNQIATAQVLQQAGNDVAFLIRESVDKLTPFLSRSFSLDQFKLLRVEEFLDDAKVTLPSALKEEEVEKIESRLPKYNRNVYTALQSNMVSTLSRINSLISDFQPSAIVLSDDGVACNIILASLAKALGISVVCCPYGDGGYQDLENTVGRLAESGGGYSVDSACGDIIAEYFPKWVKSGAHAGRILLRPEVILAREVLGISISNPWQVYGSEADYFSAPGEEYKNKLINRGFPKEKIYVTGSANGFLLERAIRALPGRHAGALLRPGKIDKAKTKALIALPPNYHSTRSDLVGEWETFPALVRDVVAPLNRLKDVQLTVTAHPATATSDLEALKKSGIEIDDRYIIELIATNDLFITDFSSTVRWAIACGKPVINYDFYGFQLDMFSDVPGVILCNDYNEYCNLVNLICSDSAHYEKLATEQLQVADYWGRIDSHFPDLFSSLIQEHASDTIHR